MRNIPFHVEAQSGGARAGVLEMDRRTVLTPVFMPVGTQAAVRGTPPDAVEQTGTPIVLANTYHLSQRPGEAIIKKAGGLHAFMGIRLPILTDSGGFQVFSLGKLQVDEEGVTFAYEVDGNLTHLSPERSMEIQQALGADIAMVFDECLPFGVDRVAAERSLERTHRWERRCKTAHRRADQSLFGIVQGAFWPDLRRRSAAAVAEIGFDGYAIGGLAVGEDAPTLYGMIEETTPFMPVDHPRYLMGVGRPVDLVEGVSRGVDMFDCVIPSRHARSGVLYTDVGRVRISDRRYRNDLYPPDTRCDCYTCRTFTRAYLHHLFRVGEILGPTLATIHNLRWYARFMADMRTAIVEGSFEAFRANAHSLHRHPEHEGTPS
jgi:queuine tRNA-ribosyltransferase